MSSKDYNEEPWMVSQTVASWISVLGVALAITAILQDRFQRVQNRDTRRIAADESKMGYFYVQPLSKFAALLGESTKELRVTTIRGLVEAGDMGLWTSASVDQLRTWHGEICWVALYRSVFKMVAERKQITPNDYGLQVSEFLRRAGEHVKNERLQHDGQRETWEDLKQQINNDMEFQDGRSVVLERVKQDLDDLRQKNVAPLRVQLYENTINYIHTPACHKNFTPVLSKALASLRGIFGRFRRNYIQTNRIKQSNNGNYCEEAQLDGKPDWPKLISCIRNLDPPKKITFFSIPIGTRPHTTQTKSSVASPRGKFVRSYSLETGHSGSSNTPTEHLQEMRRQFYRWVGSGNLSLKNREALKSMKKAKISENLQYGEEPFRRLEIGLNDIRPAWVLDEKPCIEISREELAALAIILGMQLKINEFSNTISGIGAFGTSLSASQSNGHWKVNLVHGSRTPSHCNSQGSGYTTLMAKHIACGSIPFADSAAWIRCVYITEEVLAAIKEGRHIKDSQEYGGSSLEYLRRLPSAKQIDAFYGVTKESADLKAAQKKQDTQHFRRHGFHGSLSIDMTIFAESPNSGPSGETTPAKSDGILDLGAILKADGMPIGNNCSWPRTVAGIAFGGLVPQAACRLVEAVRFTVAGKFGGCMNALERLINKIHRFDKSLEVFGPYVARRVAAKYGVENIDYSTPSRNMPREAAAIFSRYMNLLEYLTARCSAPGIESSVDTVYETSCELIEVTYLSAITKEGFRYSEDLCLAVDNVTLGLNRHSSIAAEDCAVVVRCILAAWAEQVPCIDLEESHGRSKDKFTFEPQYCQVNRAATLEDLPAVSALG